MSLRRLWQGLDEEVGNSHLYRFWRAVAKGTEEMFNDLLVTVREKIGPIATPDYIQNAPGLPKTRSGMFRGSRHWDWDWPGPSGGGVCGWKPSAGLGWVSVVTR